MAKAPKKSTAPKKDEPVASEEKAEDKAPVKKKPNPPTKPEVKVPEATEEDNKPKHSSTVLTASSAAPPQPKPGSSLAKVIDAAPDGAIICVNNEMLEVEANKIIGKGNKLVSLRPKQEVPAKWKLPSK